MKLYSVFDELFNQFSDPFLAADDTAAERLMVQTALLSDVFRSRVHLSSLYCLGTYDADSERPGKFFRNPSIVFDSRHFSLVVTKAESQIKRYSEVQPASDSEVKEDSEIE